MNGTLRGAVEGYNLATNLRASDVLFAECIRTFPTAGIDAQQWLHKLEVELGRNGEMRVDVFVPVTRRPNVRSRWSKAPMVDIYGYRSLESTPFALLSPFEFIRYWEAEPLLPPSWYHDTEPKTMWTSEGKIAQNTHQYRDGKLKLRAGMHFRVIEPTTLGEYYTFPEGTDGKDNAWRHNWIITRKPRPRVPVIEGVPTPSPAKSAEENSKYFSVFQALVFITALA